MFSLPLFFHSLLSLIFRMWGVAPIMQAGSKGREETQGELELKKMYLYGPEIKLKFP